VPICVNFSLFSLANEFIFSRSSDRCEPQEESTRKTLQCHRTVTPVSAVGMKGRVCELEKGGNQAMQFIEAIDERLEW